MNNTIFYFLHSFAFQYQWLDSLIWFFAVPFICIVLVLVAVFLLIHYKVFSGENNLVSLWNKGKNIKWIFLSALFAYGVSYILKILIHTDRPFIIFADVHSLFAETGYSFPSSHSAIIAGLAFAVYFRNKQLGYVCFVAALLIGLARIAAGVHFPIDIVGGYALGFIVAFFTKRL